MQIYNTTVSIEVRIRQTILFVLMNDYLISIIINNNGVTKYLCQQII